MGLVPRLEASVNDKIYVQPSTLNDNEHARSGIAATPVMSEDTRLHVRYLESHVMLTRDLA